MYVTFHKLYLQQLFPYVAFLMETRCVFLKEGNYLKMLFT